MEQPGLEGKKLTRDIPEGSKSLQEDHLGLQSLGYERIDMVTGIGKDPVKGGEIERGNGRSPVSSPMTDQEIVIIEMIDTIEIVTELETERGRKTEGVNVTVTEHVIVIAAGIVVVIMNVIEKKTVIGSVIVIALVKGRGTGIMKLVTLTVTKGIPVIGILTMIVLIQNMSETAMVKGTMILLTRKMIVDGMTAMRTMSIIGVMVIMTVIISTMMMIMTAMIRWRKMITVTTVQRLSHVTRREHEIWIVNIDAWVGRSLCMMMTEKAGIQRPLSLTVESLMSLVT